jgi:uncharacterized protein YhhL (DUF1145 family)
MHYYYGKIGAGALWFAVLLAAMGKVPAPFDRLLILVGGVTAVAHVFEMGLFLVKYRERSDNVFSDALQVLVFGVFHLWPLTQRMPPPVR